MKCHVLFRTSILLWLVVFSQPCRAATITWSNYPPEGPTYAVDSRGEPLWGTIEFSQYPDLSLGALVQLWKAVGEIDDPTGNPDAYRDLGWHVDDVLLDESHMGFAAPNQPNGAWSHTGDYALNYGDIMYVRAYNVSKPDFASTPITERELTIRNRSGEIVSDWVGSKPYSPQTYFFDHLQTRPIPEPSAVLMMAAAIPLFCLKSRKRGFFRRQKECARSPRSQGERLIRLE